MNFARFRLFRRRQIKDSYVTEWVAVDRHLMGYRNLLSFAWDGGGNFILIMTQKAKAIKRFISSDLTFMHHNTRPFEI